MTRFENRREAGGLLVEPLRKLGLDATTLVLALPRGGVPVAYEIATALGLSLDVFLVRKLGVPECEELAMGALASGGLTVFNQEVLKAYRISGETLDAVSRQERAEIQRRERLYRAGRGPLAVAGRSLVLVDDGLATGATMLAAVRTLAQAKPSRLCIGIPVGPQSVCAGLSREVDELVCLATPSPFHGVAEWYKDFRQTSDEEVIELLANAAIPKAG